MAAAIACVGDSFSGYCSVCERDVSGAVTNGEFAAIEGKAMCVTGSRCVAFCGHEGTAIGKSESTVNGKAVVRVGDRVEGTVAGVITSGSFVFID